MFFRTLLVATVGLWLAGCNTTTPGGGASAPAGTNPKIPESSSIAALRPGDSLTIGLQGVMDPRVEAVQIDEQGQISLPHIGTIKAAGLGTSELQQRIIEAYVTRKVYTSLAVAVSVTERFIYVGGEVTRGGRIVWTRDLTVAKAIQAAGGFSLYAKETAVNLTRDNATYSIDVKLALRNPDQDPPVLPGDSIQVPRSRF